MRAGNRRFALFLMVSLSALLLPGCPPPAPGSPHADFEADVTSGDAPLEVHFTDLSDPGLEPIKSWIWMFGDGRSSIQQDPVHTYEDPGSYRVSLTVTTDIGVDMEVKSNYITAEGEGEGEGEGETETVMLPGSVELEMVKIPAGTFMMGCNTEEQDGETDEEPRHQVTVPAFWMSRYEVTKRQWQAVMNTTPWTGRSYVSNNLDSPAVWVSWDDAKSFITALNAYTAKTFRLPSEAEWEYACRAGTTTRYYWGEDADYTLIDSNAWWYSIVWGTGQRYARDVGLKLDNDFELYDMSGNVWEWCEDDYHTSYTSAPTNGSAWITTPRAMYRILRGGGWYNGGAAECRSAERAYTDPTNKGCDYGFRLVR